MSCSDDSTILIDAIEYDESCHVAKQNGNRVGQFLQISTDWPQTDNLVVCEAWNRYRIAWMHFNFIIWAEENSQWICSGSHQFINVLRELALISIRKAINVPWILSSFYFTQWIEFNRRWYKSCCDIGNNHSSYEHTILIISLLLLFFLNFLLIETKLPAL